jgi:hypothetical protein
VSQFPATPARAQGAGYDDQDSEVLTRGPVHEAFATVVDYNPGRGLVTRQRPPDPIEELPPEERPEGGDVAWIPGYWAWDDERSDYIWVSGTWRVPPPGREWVPGYWADSEGEYIWIAGYWAEIETRQTTYLPPPPSTLERGPNIARPSLDYGWTPGCWVWQRSGYVWRPGYWARGRGDWIWIPSYYVWTPHGYIFIDGYWDYVVARRGILYAPVRFRSRAYVRHGYVYSPRIVFNIGIFSDHLFLRPRWCHYYFGDYYAPRYASAGFYFTFSYHNSWRGYDPFYSYWRWENRRVRDWDSRYQESYRYRRDHEIARPPGTWSAQVAIHSSTTTTQDRVIVAGTTTQLASAKTFSPKLRKVNEDERRSWADRGRQVRTSRDERRTLEVRAPVGTSRNTGSVAEPARVERPRSAIASRPVRELQREFTPPRAPTAPKPDPKIRPEATAQSQQPAGPPKQVGPHSNTERPAQSRTQNAERAQERGPAVQRETGESRRGTGAQRRATESEARARNEVQARERNETQAREVNEAQARERSETARRVREAEARERSESQARAERERAQKARVREDARQKVAEAQRLRDLQAAERRAKDSEARAKREAQAREKREAAQRAKIAQAQAKAEANRRAKEAGAKKRNESQGKQKGNSKEEGQDSGKNGKGNGRP